MPSQLEQLARPFPSKYVKPPAQGKYGSYIDHEIINQALLLILGPFSFRIEQVITNPDGLVDGCTASLTATIDGREVTVTEAGDCEHAATKKTQGERLKNAASDALKRCAMRLGCGIHLWAGNAGDFFLYDSLVRQSAEAGVGTGSRADTPPASAPHAGAGGNFEPRTEPEKSRVPERAASATSGSRGSTQSSQREPGPAGVSVRPPTPETPAAPSDPGKWIPPASEMFDALALRKSLHSRGISFYDVKKREGLPNLEDVDNEADFRLYQRVLADLDTANPVTVNA